MIFVSKLKSNVLLDGKKDAFSRMLVIFWLLVLWIIYLLYSTIYSICTELTKKLFTKNKEGGFLKVYNVNISLSYFCNCAYIYLLISIHVTLYIFICIFLVKCLGHRSISNSQPRINATTNSISKDWSYFDSNWTQINKQSLVLF